MLSTQRLLAAFPDQPLGRNDEGDAEEIYQVQDVAGEAHAQDDGGGCF